MNGPLGVCVCAHVCMWVPGGEVPGELGWSCGLSLVVRVPGWYCGTMVYPASAADVSPLCLAPRPPARR